MTRLHARRSKCGAALAATLLYITVLTTLFGSLIAVVLNEYRFTKATTARTQALYAAEAGITLAFHEFNRKDAELAWKGWVPAGNTFRLESSPAVLRENSSVEPSMEVVADTAAKTITAVGHARCPGLPQATRKVVVTLKPVSAGYVVDLWLETSP